MFGPRLSRVFASRWSALWWAASILLLAWQLVPDAADDAPPSEAGAPDAAATASAAPANPWALETPGATP